MCSKCTFNQWLMEQLSDTRYVFQETLKVLSALYIYMKLSYIYANESIYIYITITFLLLRAAMALAHVFRTPRHWIECVLPLHLLSCCLGSRCFLRCDQRVRMARLRRDGAKIQRSDRLNSIIDRFFAISNG